MLCAEATIEELAHIMEIVGILILSMRYSTVSPPYFEGPGI
jgi:hypothetical protein